MPGTCARRVGDAATLHFILRPSFPDLANGAETVSGRAPPERGRLAGLAFYNYGHLRLASLDHIKAALAVLELVAGGRSSGATRSEACYHFSSRLVGRARMAQLLVRDLDPAVVARLKEKARQNRRSLQGEVKAILEEAAERATREEALGR